MQVVEMHVTEENRRKVRELSWVYRQFTMPFLGERALSKMWIGAEFRLSNFDEGCGVTNVST